MLNLLLTRYAITYICIATGFNILIFKMLHVFTTAYNMNYKIMRCILYYKHLWKRDENRAAWFQDTQ